MKTPALLSSLSHSSVLASMLSSVGAAHGRQIARAALPAVLWTVVLSALGYLLVLSGAGVASAAHSGNNVCLLDQILNVIGPSLEFDSIWG